ncbi:MAG: rhodanese-like domain-containing protein [Myxococcales bacterium]|nr:rhodanese-like domain-containing protein [Myxococcales bacterium]
MLRFLLGDQKTSLPNAGELVAKGAVLLDVRTPQEFADDHVIGALNVPVQELSSRLDELGPKERPIVIYCRSGARSANAKHLLEGAGFRHVHDMGAMFNVTGLPRKNG